MNQQLPLHQLLLLLEQADFHFDPAAQYRIQQVLQQLGNKYWNQPEKIQLILGPIVAKNAEEQARFKEVFDLYWKSLQSQELEAVVETSADSETQNIQEKVRKRRIWVYPIAIALALIVGLSIYMWNNFQAAEVDMEPDMVIQDLPLEEREAYSTENPPSIDYFIDGSQSTSKEKEFFLDFATDKQKLRAKDGLLFEMKSNMPEFSQCEWDFGDGGKSTLCNPYHMYENPGVYKVSFSTRVGVVEESRNPVAGSLSRWLESTGCS